MVSECPEEFFILLLSSALNLEQGWSVVVADAFAVVDIIEVAPAVVVAVVIFAFVIVAALVVVVR